MISRLTIPCCCAIFFAFICSDSFWWCGFGWFVLFCCSPHSYFRHGSHSFVILTQLRNNRSANNSQYVTLFVLFWMQKLCAVKNLFHDFIQIECMNEKRMLLLSQRHPCHRSAVGDKIYDIPPKYSIW